MLAAAICANGNQLELPDEVASLAPRESLDQAIGWGLAVRLCRRLGARSRPSLQRGRLVRDGKTLVVALEKSHAPLYGVPVEKDHLLLANWLGLTPEVRVLNDGETLVL